jgi:2-methylisocitrate lyase-like PEP mutase family enzyme
MNTLLSFREKSLLFQELHQGSELLLIPNPWDAGSARMLEHLGFKALATSSSAFAATLGRRDGFISREELFDHARSLAAATNLPVAADMESGFATTPEGVAETIRLAAAAGLSGGSIEDFAGPGAKAQFEIAEATERIAAAASAAKALSTPFILTARAENFFRGNPDLTDTIKRLVAYEQAGADVLFAPALPNMAAVKEICAAVRKPVNFMVGIKGKSFTVAELAAAGVKRISFASSLYRAAMTGLWNAAHEIRNNGTFDYLDTSLPMPEINKFLGDTKVP